MSVHPLWMPLALVSAEDDARARVRPTPTESGRFAVAVVAPDPAWSLTYEQVAALVRGALGDRVQAVQHIGSTSVPGLAAKPIIDIDLIVADPADEAAYVPDLTAVGFDLWVREPDWQQHRMLRLTDPRTNLHVFGPDAVEPRRHRAFRDWLIGHPEDRAAYAERKQTLAAQTFDQRSGYNNAKAELIYDIYERIFAADPEHDHTPRSRD